MTATIANQINIDARGVAWLSGSKVKVVEVVTDNLAHGWTPEEIHLQHPNLSRAQIDAAMTFYHENRSELDAEIEASLRESMTLAAELSDPVFHERLIERSLNAAAARIEKIRSANQ